MGEVPAGAHPTLPEWQLRAGGLLPRGLSAATEFVLCCRPGTNGTRPLTSGKDEGQLRSVETAVCGAGRQPLPAAPHPTAIAPSAAAVTEL